MRERRRSRHGGLHYWSLMNQSPIDALLSERPYKQPWPLADVLREIRREAGYHFDPRLTEIFLSMAVEVHAELGYRSPARQASHAEHAARVRPRPRTPLSTR